GLSAGRTVLDVGAGTGKLTRLLLSTGARVLALEPVEGMREQLVAAVPGIELAGGTAEASELPHGAVDAITAPTALHWFDTEPALAAFLRVLSPGGALALLWNVRDESAEWVRAVSAVIRAAVERNSEAAALRKARSLEREDWRPVVARSHLFER